MEPYTNYNPLDQFYFMPDKMLDFFRKVNVLETPVSQLELIVQENPNSCITSQVIIHDLLILGAKSPDLSLKHFTFIAADLLVKTSEYTRNNFLNEIQKVKSLFLSLISSLEENSNKHREAELILKGSSGLNSAQLRTEENCLLSCKNLLSVESVIKNFISEKHIYNSEHFLNRYLVFMEKLTTEWNSKINDGKTFSMKFPVFNYPMRSLEKSYRDHHDTFFTPEELELTQVFIVNGTVYNSDMSFYNSRVTMDRSKGNGEMIVMDQAGCTFIAVKDRARKIHHSSFFSGAPVAYAGLCYVVEGKIKVLDDSSGHYKTSFGDAQQFTNHYSSTFLVQESA